MMIVHPRATDRHAFTGLTIETMIIIFTIVCSPQAYLLDCQKE